MPPNMCITDHQWLRDDFIGKAVLALRNRDVDSYSIGYMTLKGN